MAESFPPLPSPIDPEKRREELAYLEGHDADIPTEDQSPRGLVAPTPELHGDSDAEKGSETVNESVTDLRTDDDPEKGSEKANDLEAGHKSGSTSLTEAEVQTSEPQDQNVVWWDGPDDPENPLNWSEGLKLGNVAVISMVTFITQVSRPASSFW